MAFPRMVKVFFAGFLEGIPPPPRWLREQARRKGDAGAPTRQREQAFRDGC